MELITRTKLTCPQCGFVTELEIPADYCLFFHVCAGCGVRLRPLPGDCCVICSYGDVRCISKQLETQASHSPDILVHPDLWNELDG